MIKQKKMRGRKLIPLEIVTKCYKVPLFSDQFFFYYEYPLTPPSFITCTSTYIHTPVTGHKRACLRYTTGAGNR